MKSSNTTMSALVRAFLAVLFTAIPGASLCDTSKEVECLTALQRGRMSEVRRILGTLTPEQRSGNPDFLYVMGVCADEGLGQKVDFNLAYQCYTKADGAGSMRARAALILLICNGQGVTRDVDRARKLYEASRGEFEKRAFGGDPFLLYYLAMFRRGFDQDEKGWHDLLRQSSAKGFFLPRIVLDADALFDDALRPNAIQSLKKASADGFWQADWALLAYFIDEDDPIREGAGTYFANCCQNLAVMGNHEVSAEAAFLMYRCVSAGIGCKADPAIALQWLQVAARNGEALAQYQLGLCLFTGNGVARDQTAAVGWFRRASEQNVVYADMMLAACLSCGFGVPVDMEAARAHYCRAKPFLDRLASTAANDAPMTSPAPATSAAPMTPSAPVSSSAPVTVNAATRLNVDMTLDEYARTRQMDKYADLLLKTHQSGSCSDTYSMGLHLAKKNLMRDALESFDLAEQRRVAEINAGIQDSLRPTQNEIAFSRQLCITSLSQTASRSSAGRRAGREARRAAKAEQRREKFCNVCDSVRGVHGWYKGRHCPACSAPQFPGVSSVLIDDSRFTRQRRR